MRAPKRSASNTAIFYPLVTALGKRAGHAIVPGGA